MNNDSNLQSHTVNSTVNMNNSDTNNAFTLNTHRQEIRSSGVQKYGQVEGETNEVVIDSTIITTTNPSVFSDEKQSSSVVNTNALQTLTSLAKSGKINSAHSLFDVEVSMSGNLLTQMKLLLSIESINLLVILILLLLLIYLLFV